MQFVIHFFDQGSDLKNTQNMVGNALLSRIDAKNFYVKKTKNVNVNNAQGTTPCLIASGVIELKKK